MNSRERVTAVLNHQIPDRVPVYEVLIDPPVVERELGIAGQNSAMLSPADMVKLHKKLGLDGVICGLKFFRPTQQIKGGQPPLSSIVPPSRQECDALLHRAAEVARIAHEEGMAAAAYTHGAFDVLYESLGFENFMLLLYDDFEYVNGLADLLFAHHLKSAQEALQTEIDWMVVGDDVAFKTGLFIGPEMFLSLWKERETRMIQTIRAAGRPVEFHTDGKLEFVLPHLIEMGVALVNPVEPYCNDIRQIKEQYGGRIALRGNVDIAGVLALGTPQETYEETRRLVLDMKPGGNYVCSSSHSVSAAVLPDNYRMLVKAVQDHGGY